MSEIDTEGPKKGFFQNKYAIPQNLITHLVIMCCKGEWVFLNFIYLHRLQKNEIFSARYFKYRS